MSVIYQIKFTAVAVRASIMPLLRKLDSLVQLIKKAPPVVVQSPDKINKSIGDVVVGYFLPIG